MLIFARGLLAIGAETDNVVLLLVGRSARLPIVRRTEVGDGGRVQLRGGPGGSSGVLDSCVLVYSTVGFLCT